MQGKTIAISKTARVRGMADGGVKIYRLTSATSGRRPQVIWLSRSEMLALRIDLNDMAQRDKP